MKFLGGDATRPLTTHPEHRLRAGRRDEIRDPVPGAVQRIDPLQHRDARRNHVARQGCDRCQAAAKFAPERLGPVLAMRRLPDHHDRLEHIVERHRIHGQHVGVAPQVPERVVHFGHIDRAHRAQILGDDEIGRELAQRAFIEVVQVVAGRDACTDLVIDLRRGQSGRQRRVRHDATSSRLRRIVALEGDADDVGACAHREQDLRRGGQQRHDPHDRER